jgi:type IV pilus assembly protein PilO
MKDPVRRDTILTIVGLSLLAAVFMFAVHLPNEKACAQLKREISTCERSIQEVPLRVAELESLNREIQRRLDYLDRTSSLLPFDADLHSVVARVSDLAQCAELTEGALEPLDVIEHATYQVVPFRFNFSGDYASTLAFLAALENSERLFTIDEFRLTGQGESAAEVLEGDIVFSVYEAYSVHSDSDENDASSDSLSADNQ